VNASERPAENALKSADDRPAHRHRVPRNT